MEKHTRWPPCTRGGGDSSSSVFTRFLRGSPSRLSSIGDCLTDLSSAEAYLPPAVGTSQSVDTFLIKVGLGVLMTLGRGVVPPMGDAVFVGERSSSRMGGGGPGVLRRSSSISIASSSRTGDAVASRAGVGLTLPPPLLSSP